MENRSQVGGILSIISGAFGFLYAAGIIFMFYFFREMVGLSSYGSKPFPDEGLTFMTFYFGAIGLFYAILGALAIVGGIFALKKKIWGLALAGAITGAMTFFPCGITAVIFISMGQSEFKKPEAQVTTG